nr:PREDICTED: protein PFC0760c-like [Daucus carota subsp. sativus]
MALKSILIDEDENDEELNEELQNLDESEIALLTRQLRRVLQSKAQRPNYSQNYTPNHKSNYPTTGYNKGKVNQSPNAYNHANNNHTYTPPKPKEQNPEEAQDVCFECKQPGHFKRECPKLSKGRILVAENGWDLSEDEEISETNEEVVNLCLMALEDDSSSSDVSTSNDEVSSRSKVLHNLHLFSESSLHLLDLSKSDLIDLVVEINKISSSANQRTLSLWSEKENIEKLNKTQEEELSRIKDLNLKNEEEISSLCEQNDILKNEHNKSKDIIMRLEVENVSLVLQTEELENEKLQLNGDNTKLHIDLLNLKIQNESLTQEKSTSVSQKDNFELVHALNGKDKIFELETQKLKDEHTKFLAPALDRERTLNDKLNVLIKENQNLEVVLQRFTKGNKMLDRMVHSKTSYNHEGLGYDKNAQPKKFVQDKKQTTFVPASPRYKCLYCNKDGHTVEYCRIKNGEIKGKYVWVRKVTKPYHKVDQKVCLVTKHDMWYLDSGCSRHMTGNKSLLNGIRKVAAGSVTFGDSSKGSIIGIGDIGNEHFKIANVQLVTGLKYNLLSISQLCDNGYKVLDVRVSKP